MLLWLKGRIQPDGLMNAKSTPALQNPAVFVTGSSQLITLAKNQQD